jgi:hypothetical protein
MLSDVCHVGFDDVAVGNSVGGTAWLQRVLERLLTQSDEA